MENGTPRIDAIVESAATITADEIPYQATLKAIDLFVDTIGCIFAGSTAEGINELKKTVLYWSTSPQATILISGEKTSAPYAALINSVMGHSRDFDDAHDLAANHGSVVMVPALLATAEACSLRNNTAPVSPFRHNQISGKELIAALAVGLEVTNRLAMSFAKYLHAGWLPTTLWGPFGAAAACGRLLSLSKEKMHHAFGLAYSQIHGNRQALIDGSLAKRIQPGFSAMAGLHSAFLAASGITAAKNVISGDFGIPILYTGGNIDTEYINTGLGLFEETMNISIKPYPSCRCTHAVIDAVLAIQKQYMVSWNDIESGIIYLPPNSMAQIGKPFVIRNNPTVDAQFSAQYVAALTFIHGKPRIVDFETEKIISRQEVIQLAHRLLPVEFEEETVEIGLAELEISLKNGQVLHYRIEKVKGSPANPLSTEEQESKFLDCLDKSGRIYSWKEKKSLLSTARAIMDFDDIAQFVDSIQKYGNKPIATRGKP
jgi:2-methylcitrate dehydratase PrpD